VSTELRTGPDGVLAASRVLVGISAQSITEVSSEVSLAQLRTLVVICEHQPISLTALAAALGVHTSGASRICDRLVQSGLLYRREDAGDRRVIALSVTDRGSAIVDRVMTFRRRAVEQILDRMDRAEAARLDEVLSSFAAAAGDPALGLPELRTMGWTIGNQAGDREP
jgi:DNA-binding MarR family transcriptional regulator